MKMSMLHCPTLKEAPKEAEVQSHRLLIRAGYMRKLAAGIYDFLPLGIRTLSKIKQIIREELDRAGAQEVLLPAVQPSELWMESGRWEQYGPELLRFKDRKGTMFCLGPTHEEVIVDLVRRDVRSYRQLPLNLYQIQTKFRDEIRPRAGLMRGREFIMKDAYSFDVDDDKARESYRKMHDAYHNIFRRCGLEFRAVDADPGNIGGTLSQEFQVLADTGEDSIVSCPACSYTANIEKAELVPPPPPSEVYEGNLEKIFTPNRRTVADVTDFLRIPATSLAKTLFFVADGKPVAALIRGDHELNEIKLKNALAATTVYLADDASVVDWTGAPSGFVGPVGLSGNVTLLVDPCVAAMPQCVTGANELDQHFVGVVPGRDFPLNRVVDLRLAKEGDPCPKCREPMAFFRGIEVGHIFFLGTKYSIPMKCTYLDERGNENPMVMGCYGIGVTRVMAAAVEQHNDDRGIRWPTPIAPFQVHLITLGTNDDDVVAASDMLYQKLLAQRVEVLLDDRDERPGAKLKDADLIGLPIQVICGKKSLEQGGVEVRTRVNGESRVVSLIQAADVIRAAVVESMAQWSNT
ncbi:MAG: proline--tRNA ligase [Myxococcales bacterium]|nr:proline--tRNA ligase [Myxococcales bacterium]